MFDFDETLRMGVFYWSSCGSDWESDREGN